VILPDAAKKSDLYKPIRLKHEKSEENRSRGLQTEFSLKKFTSALRQRIQDDKECEEMELWNRYLDSQLSSLSSIPQPTCETWKELLQTFVSCLRQEGHSALQFEAACGIIKMKGVKALKRWDSLAYKQVLDQMLSHGNPYQKQVASMECLETGGIDVRVIQQVRLGLGDADDEKRQLSIHRLGNLSTKFAEAVVQVLRQDAKHTSWRVRLDVVTLLKVWIPKLTPPFPPPPPPRDPDALETDTEEVLKALFQSGSKPEEEPKGLLSGMMSTMFVNDIPDSYQGDEKLYGQCIHLLLEMMSNDWSVEVKSAASQALGELKQGISVLQWVFKSMKSLDPTKRVDALKCLSFMAVVPKDNLNDFVQCFRDPYSSVRIGACKVKRADEVAFALKSSENQIVMAILDLLDDLEYRVRAYAIKGTRY
jgi:hypothetical protein